MKKQSLFARQQTPSPWGDRRMQRYTCGEGTAEDPSSFGFVCKWIQGCLESADRKSEALVEAGGFES